jgi:hypothetical protein
MVFIILKNYIKRLSTHLGKPSKIRSPKVGTLSRPLVTKLGTPYVLQRPNKLDGTQSTRYQIGWLGHPNLLVCWDDFGTFYSLINFILGYWLFLDSLILDLGYWWVFHHLPIYEFDYLLLLIEYILFQSRNCPTSDCWGPLVTSMCGLKIIWFMVHGKVVIFGKRYGVIGKHKWVLLFLCNLYFLLEIIPSYTCTRSLKYQCVDCWKLFFVHLYF